MKCDECKGEHALAGRVLVDGAPLPLGAFEVVVEVLCKHGGLPVRREPVGEAAMVEPDALPGPGQAKSPPR